MKTYFRIGIFGLVLAMCELGGCVQQRNFGTPMLTAPPSTATDSDIYIAENGARIRAFDPSGKEQWAYSLADDLARLNNRESHDFQIIYLTARTGGKLYGLAKQVTGGHVGETFLFEVDKGRLLWQRLVPRSAESIVPIAVGKDLVYEVGDNGIIYAFAATDGGARWQYRVAEGTLGTPTVNDEGTLYITGPRGNLHAIAPDGSQRWVIETQR